MLAVAAKGATIGKESALHPLSVLRVHSWLKCFH